MKTKSPVSTWIILGSALLVSFAFGKTLQAATELAKINGQSITLEDFNRRYQEAEKLFQLKRASRKVFLEDLIKRDLAIQEAKKEGLDKDPEVIERMNAVLYQSLLTKKLASEFEDIHVSDSEAKDYYAKNPEVRTSQIFVGVRSEAKPDEVKKALQKIKAIQEEELKDGKKNFSEVAQRRSEGLTAAMGGDIDYQTKDKLDPLYYETALKLRTPGKVSDIIKTQFGFHIVKLTGIKPWDEADHAMVKRLVFEEKRAQIYEHYMSKLRAEAKVQVHSELLKD